VFFCAQGFLKAGSDFYWIGNSSFKVLCHQKPMILGASSPATPVTMLLPFDEVAQDLAQEQNLIRIKKLLVYICTQVWEGDRDRLNQVSLLNLLQDLRATAPTAEQLQSRLDIAVHSLSKAAEYTLVSSVIMRRVARLYPDMGTRRGLAGEEAYGTIAQSLAENASGDRIKKLLLLACKNTWITDAAQLAKFNLVDLVRELHGLTPSLMTLQAVLESLVNTLSKRAEYTLAAHEICSAFQPLYVEAVTEIRTEARTEIVVVDSPSTPPAASHKVSDLADLFNLRLEIMRYSNPYRVKIVLFSLLCQPFVSQAEHESMLKSYTLDDLLRSMIQSYKLPELEIMLLNTARNLEDSEESLQAARAVLGAVKPFYAHLPSSFAVAEEAEDATAFMGSQILAKKMSRADLRRLSDEESAELTIAQAHTMPGASFRPSQILTH
jgi:hypothetical protein